MKTYKSESNVSPLEWDLESSATLKYHNYNVETIERENEFNKEKETFYIYDVDAYTTDEYMMMELKKDKNSLQELTNLTNIILGIN